MLKISSSILGPNKYRVQSPLSVVKVAKKASKFPNL